MTKAWDADGHVEEWEGTFADDYLEPAFREQRPVVVQRGNSASLAWKVPGRPGLYKVGGSPTSKNGMLSDEQSALAEWRGPVASAEARTAKDRLSVLEAEDTVLEVNYPTMFLGWPVTYDQPLSQALTRSYNNWIADVSNQAPDRLKWVTVIDPSDPREAAREIERTKEMGAVGVMVFGVYGNRFIDDAIFEPVWQAANDTGLSVAVHPGFAAMELKDTYKNFADFQFKFTVLMGFNRVMVSGILDRYPDLKVGFLETGCSWVDFMMEYATEFVETLEQRKRAGLMADPFTGTPTTVKLPELRPEEYVRRGQVFFGYEVDEEILSYMVDKYGADCWLYASDIPHAHRRTNGPKRLLERTDLSEEAKRKLLVDNTARFYGLPVREFAAL